KLNFNASRNGQSRCSLEFLKRGKKLIHVLIGCHRLIFTNRDRRSILFHENGVILHYLLLDEIRFVNHAQVTGAVWVGKLRVVYIVNKRMRGNIGKLAGCALLLIASDVAVLILMEKPRNR